MEPITIWFLLLLVGGQPDPGYYTDKSSCMMERARILDAMVKDGPEDKDMLGPCIEYTLQDAAKVGGVQARLDVDKI